MADNLNAAIKSAARDTVKEAQEIAGGATKQGLLLRRVAGFLGPTAYEALISKLGRQRDLRTINKTQVPKMADRLNLRRGIVREVLGDEVNELLSQKTNHWRAVLAVVVALLSALQHHADEDRIQVLESDLSDNLIKGAAKFLPVEELTEDALKLLADETVQSVYEEGLLAGLRLVVEAADEAA